MTIASEITRLQGAKASAKASIEAKWVSVPASAKVDDYHTYIDQISSGVIATMFTPASLVYYDVLTDSYNSFDARNMGLIYEWLDPANSAYYNYYCGMVDWSSSWSYGNPKICVLRKTAGSNWSVTVYTWPQYTNNSTRDYPALYDKFALNVNGALKVYVIFYAEKYVNHNYNWETVWIRDVTSWCSVLSSSFVAWISPAGKDINAINAKREELKQSVWYYTYPVLSNGWATSAPNVARDHDYGLDFTYTLNLSNV